MNREDLIEYFRHLDELCDEGIVNMLGALAFLERTYDLSKQEASQVLIKWMETFEEDTSAVYRVDKVLSGD